MGPALDAFEDLRFEAEEFVDGEDRVLVPTVGTGRGRSSGAPLELHFWNVWTVSDGKLTSCVSYGDHAEALAAAGLRE